MLTSPEKSKNNCTLFSLRRFFLFLFFLLTTLPNFAQQSTVIKHDIYAQFKNYSLGATVYDILQDSYDVVWMATSAGLIRFDGAYFTTFSPESNILFPSKHVTCVVEDVKKNIWIGTANGLLRFERKSNDFTLFKHDAADSQTISADFIKALYADSEGFIWVVSQSETMDIIDIQSNKISRKPIYNIDTDAHQFCAIYLDSGNDLWLGEQLLPPTRLKSKNIDNEFIKTISCDEKLLEATSFAETKEGMLLAVGNAPNVYRYDRENSCFRLIARLAASKYNVLTVDRSDRIWVGSFGSGLAQIDMEKNVITYFYSHDDKDKSLISNKIYCLMTDRNGCVWIGTDKGVSIYSETLNAFKYYRQIGDEFSMNYLSSNHITALLQDGDGTLWIGTNGEGIDTMNLESERFGNLKYEILLPDLSAELFEKEKEVLLQYYRNNVIYLPDDESKKRENIFSNYAAFKSARPVFQKINENAIASLYQAKNGIIFAGLDSELGFDVFDKKTGAFYRHSLINQTKNKSKFKNLSFNIEPWLSNSYNRFFEDEKDRLWVSTENDLFNYSDIVEAFSNFSSLHNLSYKKINTVFQDKKGRIWMGTSDNGAYRCNRQGGEMEHFSAQDENGLTSANVTAVFEDKEGVIWIGTDSGLNRYMEKERRFEHFLNEAPFSEYQIRSILEDDFGHLWIGASKGLIRFDKKNLKIRVFRKNNGLQGDDFSRAHAKLHDGMLAFGGENGFNIFDPAALQAEAYKTAIVFSELRVYDSLRVIDLSGRSAIRLRHDEGFFSINFSAPDYLYNNAKQYRYCLEGFEKELHYVCYPQQTARYVQVPFGKYKFRIEWTNEFGEWNDENQAVLTIILANPWYLTWQFLTLFFLVIAGITVLIVYLRGKKLKQENIRLEQTVQERTKELSEAVAIKNKFFSIISHDLRNPVKSLHNVCFNLKKHYDSLSEEERKVIIETMSETTSSTSTLLDRLLMWALSNQNQMKVSLEKLDLQEVVNSSTQELSALVRDKQIILKNQVSENMFVSADKNMLSQIINNLVSNAIKFSHQGGAITLSAVLKDDEIAVSIADEGVGMNKEEMEQLFRIDKKFSKKGTKSETGSGFGLILIKEFVEKQGGNIFVESEKEKGSTFTFTIKPYDHGKI